MILSFSDTKPRERKNLVFYADTLAPRTKKKVPDLHADAPIFYPHSGSYLPYGAVNTHPVFPACLP